MNKALISKIWLGGLVVGGLGLVLAAVGTGLMLGLGGHFVWRGADVVGFTPSFNAGFWTGVGLISGGGLVVIGGMLAQFVAWIGALINTWPIADKLWFVLLFVLGLLGFGFVIMLIYVIAGPDGLAPSTPAPAGGPTRYAPAAG